LSNGTAFARPEPPHAPEPGTRWEAVPADPHVWAPAPPPEEGAPVRTCRGQGPDGRAHGVHAVLRRRRGILKPVDWWYCAEHAEGRWVEPVDGAPAVMEWRQVPDEHPGS
jgi:hypothetical protein